MGVPYLLVSGDRYQMIKSNTVCILMIENHFIRMYQFSRPYFDQEVLKPLCIMLENQYGMYRSTKIVLSAPSPPSTPLALVLSILCDCFQEHADYTPRRCHAFVFDITDEETTLPFPEKQLGYNHTHLCLVSRTSR